MRISLQSATRKWLLLGSALFVALLYMGSASTEYLAAYFSERPDLLSLQRASRLAPGNAEYEHRIGRYFSLVAMSPSEALPHYQSAVILGHDKARYWFSLAATYQILGERAKQMDALERAIQSDPKTPDVAWQAANLYLVQGETARAMHEFRIVLENDPSLTLPALQLCWRTNPDVDSLLREVAPPLAGVYATLLDFMISRKQPAAAAKVWTKMVELHQTIETRSIFAYVRYLVQQREELRALRAAQPAAAPAAPSVAQEG